MSPHNLQVQISAMAVLVRAEGMKAENAIRESAGLAPAYGDGDFEAMACDLDRLMQDVTHE